MKKSKGTSLIEVLIALFLIAIISQVVFSLFIYNYKDYRRFFTEERKKANIEEGFIFMEKMLLEPNTYAEIKENTIVLKKYDLNTTIFEDSYNIIKKKNDKLIIEYYAYKSLRGTNVIINQLTDFQVIRNKNLIYFSIKINEDKEKLKCVENIDIKRVKEM